MAQEIDAQLSTAIERVQVHPIDERLEPALLSLAKDGLPPHPTHLELDLVVWGGVSVPDIDIATVDEDGTLRLEAQPPSDTALIPSPRDWESSCFTATVRGHGALTVEKGMSAVIRSSFGSHGSEVIAAVNGWAWKATTSADEVRLWAAPLRFMSSKPPIVLWWPQGNMLLGIEKNLLRGWRFDTQRGQAFLVPDGTHWYLALEASDASGPDPDLVHIVRSVIGFVLGEPLGVGLFRPIGDAGVLPGLIHLGLLRHNKANTRHPPALPFDCTPTWVALFVERTLAFVHAARDAPILEAIHLYFASLSGFVESNFLHAWIAVEALARWGLESGRVPDGGQLRLADHSAWLAWMRSHRSEIEALAVPGFEESLVGRVRSAEFGSPTRVQRAFRGLGIPWTAKMDDTEQVRHGVAHEASMSQAPRDWDRDRARVGLAKTMLTALLAKVIGYDGPIADRSETCFNLTKQAEPDWWAPAQIDREIDYQSRGIEEIWSKLREGHSSG